MGGNWSRDTALDPSTADQHKRIMMRVFDQLIETYGNDSGTIHVYMWTKPFDFIKRPFDRHKVVDFTLDHQNFATVEIDKLWVGCEYTIYPLSRYIRLNDEKIKHLEYVGSKQFFRGNLSSAPAHFANIAVQTMLNFGGYNFLVNNCQDYVDTYLDNIELDGFNNRRQNIEERHPNYHTDYGKIVYFYSGLILCMFCFAAVLFVLFLPWQAGEPLEIYRHSYSIPAVLQCIFMLQVAMVCLVAATAILRSIVKRNVRTGYELFSYYVTGSELTSLVTLVMICIVHMYNRNIIFFCEWHMILIFWISVGDSIPMLSCLQTISTIIREYNSSGFQGLNWSNNPAIWILIVLPKQATTARTPRYLVCLACLRVCTFFLPAYEYVYEHGLLEEAKDLLHLHHYLFVLKITFPFLTLINITIISIF
jgi:hypothetical protein